MSDQADEASKMEETQAGTRRVSARVAARVASRGEMESKEAKNATTKKRASVVKDKPKPNKKAKLEEEDELQDDVDDEPELDAIDIGGQLPPLSLKNEKGEDIDIAKLADDQGVVLFLVPKADTPGCTRQACGFADSYEEIKKLNYGVYGVSADSSTAQAKWQSKKSLPYSLISDPKRLLISALGSGEGGKTKRSHFVFEKGGKMIDKKSPVKPDDSPELALKFIQELNKE